MYAAALALIVLGLSAASAVTADAPGADSTPPPVTVLPQPPDSDPAAQLAHLVDLWHDAHLKADADLIRKYQGELLAYMQADLERTRWRYDVCRKRAGAAGLDRAGDPLSPQEQQLVDQLTDADQWLKVKKRLRHAFESSAAFSNRLRLLGDYLQVLRLESGRSLPPMADTQPTPDSGSTPLSNCDE